MILLLLLQTAAFWPVWRWYGLRLEDSLGEAAGLAALCGAAWVLAREWKRREDIPYSKIPPLPVLLTFLYAAAFPWLPPLVRATVALAALAAWLPRFGFRGPAAWHALGFLILSLPLLPTLQFYFGYPLRAAGAASAAFLLNLAGYPVIREGTLLTWQEHTVFVDAPCSGVKMIQAGLLLALFLAARRGSGLRATAALCASSLAAVLAGNVLRASALFFLETGMLRGPGWAHAGIGLASFAAAAALVMAWEAFLAGGGPRGAASPARSLPCPA